MYLKQLKSVLVHKWYFFKAGRYLGLPLRLLILHDISKLSPVEFIKYAHWFGGNKNKQDWAKAWRHHANNNKHHPEYWVLAWRGDPKFYDDIGKSLAPFVTVLPMPELYVREMVADWMAASKAFTGSYDIASWVSENGPKMLLHVETVELLHLIMVSNNCWICTDNCPFAFVVTQRFKEWDR